MNFELPLAEEKVKRQQVITLHLIVSFTLIATAVFFLLTRYFLKDLAGEQAAALVLFTLPAVLGWLVLGAGITLLGLLLFRSGWMVAKKTNRVTRIIELLVLLCLVSFAAINGMMVPAGIYALVAAAIFFAVYWEGVSDNTLYIEVNERGIRLPVTSRKRFLEWWEVENVLFRFGVLTIDCYDNRLFQWHIKSIAFDKDNFHRFCTEHITLSREKRKKYVW